MSSETAVAVRLKLKPRQEDRLLAGHAWIFSNEIAEVPEGVAAGDVVEVVSAAGQRLGAGFYNPASLIACRIVARAGQPVDEEFFRRKLGAALEYRQARFPGATSYRLCFGESDGLPGLVIDRYGDILVMQVLSAGIEARLELVGAALRSLLSPKGIYLKNDHRLRALEGLKAECRVLSGEVPESCVIEESGLKYRVPLREGQKTGFYFDQRENREFLRPYFKGQRVLDLYCYVGAFGLNAAKYGAASVFGVDSSQAAVTLAKENAQLNGLDARFEIGDAEDALKAFGEAGDQKAQPTMILLDPPSLVPSKKHLPKALRAYAKLNTLALKALGRGGLLATSTCSNHVSRELFVDMLRQAQAKAGRPTRLAALRGQGSDHPILLAMPETEYLHFALLEVL